MTEMLKALILTLALLPLHPDHGSLPRREYRVNAKGELNLLDDTMVRETLVKRGRYVLQHRVDADGHWFTFSEITRERAMPREPFQVRATVVRARETFSRFIVYAEPPVEPADPADSETAPDSAEHHAYRLVKIQLPGENVEHVF